NSKHPLRYGFAKIAYGFPLQSLAYPEVVGEPPRLSPAGSPLDALFPQESCTFVPSVPINFVLPFR
ncbi:hypothetical protein ABEY24_20870, partial [Peribacillus frigoritolerans]|uniref:hypothetical protein n=1 Tax=Peribacillus frigoritolerans TaxID=450367 RepID=UPI003D2AFE94